MADAFVGEVRAMSFGYAPKGWAQCSGQKLSIFQNPVLFSLLGTQFGGDGTNFLLPNLDGAAPLGAGDRFFVGQRGGEAAHTLTVPELPEHTHRVVASDADGDVPVPSTKDGGTILARTVNNIYAGAQSTLPLHPGTIAPTGGGGAHENRQPFMGLNLCIALTGVFPSRS